jgi:hypothetical protein
MDKIGQIEKKTLFTKNELVSYYINMFLLGTTIWLLPNNNHKMIKKWAVIIIGGLLAYKTWDIQLTYTFLHGSMLLFGIISYDAFIPHDFWKTSSFVIHAFLCVITRRLHHTNPLTIFNKSLTYKLFIEHYKTSAMIYLVWFFAYAIYAILYNGKKITMIKYSMVKFDSKTKKYEHEVTPLFYKLKYLVLHFVGILGTLPVGIVAIYFPNFDNFLVALLVLSGFIQGGYVCYSGKS